MPAFCFNIYMRNNLKLLAGALFGVLFYLGLAIAGGGGWQAFMDNTARLATAIMTIALMVTAMFTRGNLSSGVREDKSNRWILVFICVAGIAFGYLPAYWDRQNFITLGGEDIRWVGFLLYTLGGILRLYPVFVLGHRFSGLVAIQPQHTLVTTGIYSVIRHPSYLGMIINMIGWCLVLRSLGGLLIAGLFLIPLIARINSEEKMLSSEFGTEYENYRSKTSRLIPHIY